MEKTGVPFWPSVKYYQLLQKKKNVICALVGSLGTNHLELLRAGLGKHPEQVTAYHMLLVSLAF